MLKFLNLLRPDPIPRAPRPVERKTGLVSALLAGSPLSLSLPLSLCVCVLLLPSPKQL